MQMPPRTDGEEPEGDTTASVLAKLRQSPFDPVDFLNANLPPLSLSSQPQPQTPKTSRLAQLQNTSTDLLAFLSSLNTHNVRASSDLSSLTDEIIRSGNRLAYEVEVLRGDVAGLHDLLNESLRDDIAQFVHAEASRSTEQDVESQTVVADTQLPKTDPDFIVQLRLLGKVKSRLESVISLFGEAMKWPMPPSELSMASSLISVSSPELGIQNTAEDDKAREVLKSIRLEIIDLLGPEPGSPAAIDAASQRVDEYRRLVTLWKGTGEEKPRMKFVDSLAKLVEDRRKAVDARHAARYGRDASPRSSSATRRNQKGSVDAGGAAGLFRNLQRLKDDLYLE